MRIAMYPGFSKARDRGSGCEPVETWLACSKNSLRLTHVPSRPSVRTVMARLTASLLIVWAFFAGPSLCMGGLLTHSCDHEGGSDLQCQHEDSCPDDPCVTPVRSPDDARTKFEFEAPEIAVVVIEWREQFHSRVLRHPSSYSEPPPDRPKLPYAQSDRPLLL